MHDPVIQQHGDRYYLFSTGHGIPIRRSSDLINWTAAGRVFSEDFPAWAGQRVPGVAFPWAPDISFFNDQYHLYYSISTFGSQRSAIGLATNPTLPMHGPITALSSNPCLVGTTSTPSIPTSSSMQEGRRG